MILLAQQVVTLQAAISLEEYLQIQLRYTMVMNGLLLENLMALQHQIELGINVQYYLKVEFTNGTLQFQTKTILQTHTRTRPLTQNKDQLVHLLEFNGVMYL